MTTFRISTAAVGFVALAGIAGCAKAPAPPPPSVAVTPAPPPVAAPALTAAPAKAPKHPFVVPVNDDLKKVAKPLLNADTNVNIAAEGFLSAEQFLAVAHASHNLSIPFMPLKEQVLAKHKTLAQAIRVFKPKVNSVREADKATREAHAAPAKARQ